MHSWQNQPASRRIVGRQNWQEEQAGKAGKQAKK
jgi:hypothetical protein